MRLDGALCAGSDAWFPDNNQDRARVVGLCRNECPAYRECLDFALSGVPLYGVVAGLNMAERREIRHPRTKAGTLADGVCRVCDSRFVFVQKRAGRSPQYCSEAHRREFRSRDRARLLALAKATV